MSVLHFSFIYMNHFCLVFECMGPSIFDQIKAKVYKGFPLSYVQSMLKCVLPVLSDLSDLGLMHCDVKPENILTTIDNEQNIPLTKSKSYSQDLSYYSSPFFSQTAKSYDEITPSLFERPEFKLIDFGSCMFSATNTIFELQTIFYRAPEVILKIPFDAKVDIWSLGCVSSELFLGLPILPAHSEFQLASLIERTLGKFPESMIEQSSVKDQIFRPDGHVKTIDDLTAENNLNEIEVATNFFSYFTIEKIEDILLNYDQSNQPENKEHIFSFIDLITKMLKINPKDRITAKEAMNHPFLKIDFLEFSPLLIE